jgi:hypothetical protein
MTTEVGIALGYLGSFLITGKIWEGPHELQLFFIPLCTSAHTLLHCELDHGIYFFTILPFFQQLLKSFVSLSKKKKKTYKFYILTNFFHRFNHIFFLFLKKDLLNLFFSQSCILPSSCFYSYFDICSRDLHSLLLINCYLKRNIPPL